ncbi:hypothetical protein SAMN06265365_11950 [Tistlia consotensis]|uniref:HTH cro/C1-type domain-containing protein n=1 Tax=Tistlia consotensis USBA 355 TaxID=560819 RepID=A0A1Y6CD77_9PROT|nr:XRE family transcriptional regulator [Tistlia consotensis]SMF55353.1 hypothetical protein SAMN05428998_12050 [Tistlia consotensis USBA 355]SNR88246.1 hypothetical protein SAMN06265365_11950 [Tistlia consotensis]
MTRQMAGFRIRERRRELGLSQVAAAAEIGISASYLNLIEHNKRPIAGGLLRRIAEVLGLESDALTGASERRLVDDLVELAADPLVRALPGGRDLDERAAGDLVGRHPGWAQALLGLHRAHREQSLAVSALSERLQRDPFLRDSLHQILGQIATLRSTAEILQSVEDLEPEARRRFTEIVAEESLRLSGVAQGLADFLGSGQADTRPVTAGEEVDDFIIERGNYFEALEAAADELRQALRGRGDTPMSSLIDYLGSRFDVDVVSRPPHEVVRAAESGYRNLCHFDAAARTLVFLDNASISTRRFQLARLAAELGWRERLERETDDPRLPSDAARAQAFRALASYVASALLLPYERFHADAEQARYDVEILRQRYDASFEQVCHRLVTLRRPGREGVPFAFLRANPAGFTTKRFPLPGLPLTRHGHACPLWAIYGSFQTPGRVVRQLAAFPDGSRYLFIARTVTKQPATFQEQPFLHAVMLACEEIHADRTVYADGLDLAAPQTATPVGPACRLCPRPSCLHRAEAPIVSAARSLRPGDARNENVPRTAS